ncbi:MAG: IclR family transcriptional regulator C-terminal domain-containing protein [Burkholderiaceae bacterium]
MGTSSIERKGASSVSAIPPHKARSAELSATAATDVNSQLAGLIADHSEDADFVTALARGIAVMQALADKRRRMSMAQISHITGIPRAAVRRSLLTLSKIGFVAEDQDLRFCLRPRILSLSHAYLSATPLAVFAQPILDQLGEQIQEACSTAVLDGDETVYLARASSSKLISPNINVGRRVPAYCTSIGRVLLPSLSPDELDTYLSRGKFYAYTNQTVTAPGELRNIVEQAREAGYAYAREQMEPRICSFAVPVRDASGYYAAGINVILQGRLMSEEDMAAKFYQPLYQAALALGALLVH